MSPHGEWRRVVLHVDMDAFYASVEQLDDAGLRGLPVIVGGIGPRGVVAAASYEAREFGVRSAMPTGEARRLCPSGRFLRSRMERYRAVSRSVFAILHTFSPKVEALSLDEAFLDVTGARDLPDTPAAIGSRLKDLIRAETGLTASVGVAPNKLVAKIASDLDKPDGLVVVPPWRVREVLGPLPVSRLWGVGPETTSRLYRLGIETIGALAEAEEALLRRVFGRGTARIRARARGDDDRPVAESARERSISAEETFDTDLEDRAALRERLTPLCERVAKRLRRSGLSARTVTVKLRDAAFETRTRQRSQPEPIAGSREIRRIALELLEGWLRQRPGTALRLLGVGVSGLEEERQLGLFSGPSGDGRELDEVVEGVRGRFGDGALRRGRRTGPGRA